MKKPKCIRCNREMSKQSFKELGGVCIKCQRAELFSWRDVQFHDANDEWTLEGGIQRGRHYAE